MINLLLRFYDPEGGAVQLDGVDIRTLNLAWLREQIGLVSQVKKVSMWACVCACVCGGMPNRKQHNCQ